MLRVLSRQEVSQDILQQVGLPEEKKHSVRRKAAILRQQHLSPDQEVLATYRLFLETMAMAHYPKELWCPPTDYQKRVSLEIAGLEPSVPQITELFCRKKYGGRGPNREELELLRQARDRFVERMVS